MKRLRGNDAHRRAWYAVHNEMRRVRAFRMRVHHADVDDEDYTEEGSHRWSADWITVGSLNGLCFPPEWFDAPAQLPDGWTFDKMAWFHAYMESEHREGPPTPTAMPRTVRVFRELAQWEHK